MNPFWEAFQKSTEARIGLGRVGGSLPTKHLLQLKMDHALARSAVWAPCEWGSLVTEIEKTGRTAVQLKSEAKDRNSYLLNPNQGRVLSLESKERLKNLVADGPVPKAKDLALCFIDGLSSTAIIKNGIGLFLALEPLLSKHNVTKIYCIENGRVAIGDQIAEISNSSSVLVCIGERPGLTSADSLSLYYTFHPKVGNTDETRNCISNIRPGGLSFEFAIKKLLYLLEESYRLQVSGVALKERTDLLQS